MAWYRCGDGREGTAAAGDVLTGKTFTNANDVNIAGAMPNRGAWTSGTSGNGNVAIPAGYHNGSGYVSGAGAYNKGVSDADGRANGSSVNYQSGYNAGVAATKQGNAGAGDVLSGKTFTNASGVNIAGAMANMGSGLSNARHVAVDNDYAYVYPSANGYYNTDSVIRVARGDVDIVRNVNLQITTEASDPYYFFLNVKAWVDGAEVLNIRHSGNRLPSYDPTNHEFSFRC